MQQRNRHGENGYIPFRTGRFYNADNQWWFAVRRGADLGPYETKSQAKQALICYLDDQFKFEKYLQEDRALLQRTRQSQISR